MSEDPSARAGRPLTDEELVRAIGGDEIAFAAVYADLQPRLRRYAASLVGDDADDVTSEAWLHIARDLRRFDGELDAFRGWTARIVRNRAMDHLRARSRRPADLVDRLDLLERPAGDDPEVEVIETLSTRDALGLVLELPQDQAEAVLLRAVVGLDARTAGEVLGKSPAAVRVAAHRGLKRLAARIEPGRSRGGTDRPEGAV